MDKKQREKIKNKKQRLDRVFKILQEHSPNDIIEDSKIFNDLVCNLFIEREEDLYTDVSIKRFNDRIKSRTEFSDLVDFWIRVKRFLNIKKNIDEDIDRINYNELSNNTLKITVQSDIFDLKKISLEVLRQIIKRLSEPQYIINAFNDGFSRTHDEINLKDDIVVIKNTMKRAFKNLIDGIKINDILRCQNPRCKKYFINVNSRKKIYCNHLCGAKHRQFMLTTAKEGTPLHKEYENKKKRQKLERQKKKREEKR